MDESFDVNVIAQGRCAVHLHTTSTTELFVDPLQDSNCSIREWYIFEEKKERVLGISSNRNELLESWKKDIDGVRVNNTLSRHLSESYLESWID